LSISNILSSSSPRFCGGVVGVEDAPLNERKEARFRWEKTVSGRKRETNEKKTENQGDTSL
jgi:hypothetical protein